MAFKVSLVSNRKLSSSRVSGLLLFSQNKVKLEHDKTPQSILYRRWKSLTAFEIKKAGGELRALLDYWSLPPAVAGAAVSRRYFSNYQNILPSPAQPAALILIKSSQFCSVFICVNPAPSEVRESDRSQTLLTVIVKILQFLKLRLSSSAR